MLTLSCKGAFTRSWLYHQTNVPQQSPSITTTRPSRSCKMNRGEVRAMRAPLSSSLLPPSRALHISPMTYIPWVHLLPDLHIN